MNHENPHVIKIQWNLFDGYLPAPIKKVSKGNAFFIFPPIEYFSCHFCAKFEEFFFFFTEIVALTVSSHWGWAHHYGFFIWSDHGVNLAMEEWAPSDFRERSQGDPNSAVFTQTHGQEEIFCEKMQIFFICLMHGWCFLLILHRTLFLWISDTCKWEFICWFHQEHQDAMMDYQLLEKDSDGSVSLSSFDLLQVLGPRSAGAGWVRFHEHNWLNAARQLPARTLQERAPHANFSAWEHIAKHKSESVIESAHSLGFGCSCWKRLRSWGAGLGMLGSASAPSPEK